MVARKIVTGVPAVQDGQGPAVGSVSDSFFCPIILSRSIRQIMANFSGVEF